MSAKFTTTYSASELFNHLQSQGLIEEYEKKELEAFTATRHSGRELPLTLRALAGVGAFITSFCFIGFLSAAGIISFHSAYGSIVWGIFFAAGAVILARGMNDKDGTLRHSFLMQMSFCFMATGKALFLFGCAQEFSPSEQWGVIAGALLMTLGTYHLYRMSPDRFLSAFTFLFSVFFNLAYEHSPFAMPDVWLNAFFIAQLAIAAILMTHNRVRSDYMPLAYACIVSLCVSVTFFTTQYAIGFWHEQHNFNPVVINASLALALIALIGWAAGGVSRLKSEPLAMASVGAVGLGLISAPGILLSVGLMTLGYARHDRLLLVFAGALLPFFLFFYYYNLDLTLMVKSVILIGSGSLLLVGRFYMHHRGLDREI